VVPYTSDASSEKVPENPVVSQFDIWDWQSDRLNNSKRSDRRFNQYLTGPASALAAGEDFQEPERADEVLYGVV
jgi:hypothetical protein